MAKVALLRDVRLLLGAGAAKPGPAIGQVRCLESSGYSDCLIAD
jgi:hypothetical protein